MAFALKRINSDRFARIITPTLKPFRDQCRSRSIKNDHARASFIADHLPSVTASSQVSALLEPRMGLSAPSLELG